MLSSSDSSSSVVGGDIGFADGFGFGSCFFGLGFGSDIFGLGFGSGFFGLARNAELEEASLVGGGACMCHGQFTL